MSIKVDWFVPNRVIRVYVEGTVTLQELHTGTETSRNLVRSGKPLVHDIIDMRYMKKYPIKLNEIISVTSIFKEANLGWVVLLTQNPMVHFLASMTVQVYGARFHTFSEPDEAISFLQNIDSTLADLPPYTLPSHQAISD